jgi:hypothetical protein
MKPAAIILRSPDAFQKWSDGRRAQLWKMIEKLARGEISYKEAREVLREEQRVLSTISKEALGFKTVHYPSTALDTPKKAKIKRATLRHAAFPSPPQ